MLLRRLSLFRFAIQKPLKQPGIIVDPLQFQDASVFGKLTNWYKNKQTLGDMERTFSNFKRTKALKDILILNNNLVQAIQKRNLRDIDVVISEQYFRIIKSCFKQSKPLPLNYNLFESNHCAIKQARSFTQNLMRTKSTDQWYQLTIEFQNQKTKQKAYHVIQRYVKNSQWKFIKLNL